LILLQDFIQAPQSKEVSWLESGKNNKHSDHHHHIFGSDDHNNFTQKHHNPAFPQKEQKRSTFSNKIVTICLIITLICAKAALESFYTAIPLVASDYYNLSYEAVGLAYFLMILFSSF
jgi:hypothetical protein